MTILSNILSLFCRTGNFVRKCFDIDQTSKKIKVTQHQLGCEHPHIPTLLNRIGCLLTDQNEFALALPFFFEKLIVETVILGQNNPELAITLNHIVQTYHQY